MRYRIVQKTFQYEELGKSFTVAQGEIVAVIDEHIDDDLSMTILFLVKEH